MHNALLFCKHRTDIVELNWSANPYFTNNLNMNTKNEFTILVLESMISESLSAGKERHVFVFKLADKFQRISH